MTDQPKVVIVGGGFGGLETAQRLAHVAVDVTLIDRRNHHLFQPLLYQVATAGLNPSDIAQPIRHILRKVENCRVVLGEATAIDRARNVLLSDTGEVGFDYLVLATGATHAYFGNDDWAPLAPGLKSIEDALDIRRRLLIAFERAEVATSAAEREKHLTFIVVGAGPTGVELAGAISEIATTTLRGDFRSIDTSDAHVILLEGGDRVLSTFPEKLSASAERQLRKLGVDVRTNTLVTSIDEDGVDVDVDVDVDVNVNGSAARIPAATVLWGAGVAASPLGEATEAELDRAGRILVEPDLSIPGHPNIFAIGDLAAATGPDGAPVPGVAPAAQQGGEHVARCIDADLNGGDRPTFVYDDKGSLATIGRSAAVADLGPKLRFGGYLAWVIWWLVHIRAIVGFPSRARVWASWGWHYLTGRREARLITRG